MFSGFCPRFARPAPIGGGGWWRAISEIFFNYTTPGVFIDRGLRYRTSRALPHFSCHEKCDSEDPGR